MKNLSVTMLLTIVISGCSTVSPPVPSNYKGPVSSVKDSFKKHSTTKSDFFYMAKIDGKDIENNRFKTLDVNYGRGMSMEPQNVERNIPAKNTTVRLVGRTEYAAPVLALSNTVYQVAGEVNFTPEPNKKYIVAGQLGPTYSAVWLEEAGTKKLVGNKIEINGSAALGFFQK